MFDYVHENKRVVQVILLLITLPFAFWGVNSFRQSGGDALATVEGENITQQDFDNALRQQQDELRQKTRGRIDPAVLDRPEFKLKVLDQLIDNKLLLVKARAAGLEPTDRQLTQMIAREPAFQTDGQFDRQKYEAWRVRQGMPPKMLESFLKEDQATRQITSMYMLNGHASDTAVDSLIRASEQQRMVSLVNIAPDAFLSQTKVDEAAVKKYYDENRAEFSTPERARVEYVVFSADSLLPQVTASADEIKDAYEKNKGDYTAPEQRHAAHILITVPPKSGEAGKKAAMEQADSILQQIRQEPGKFAQLAKKYSKDPGSATKGGDVGFFGRGMMAKPFEDATFSLKPGEISSVVESEFGFHIIKLIEVKGGGITPVDEVKDSIAVKIKMKKAGDKFAELSEKFDEAAYTQSDSLKPASEVVKAPIKQSGWLEKGQRGASPWTDKALQAVFSEDVLKKKRNSSAIEIAPDKRLTVRLLEFQAAGTKPFADVAEAIKKKLVLQQASELAAKQGQTMLAQLQRGEKTSLKWVAVKDPLSRMHPAAGMDLELTLHVLQADVSKLPAYVGVESPQGGYMLARVDAVKETGPIDEVKRADYSQRLRQVMGEELLKAYIAEARKHASISSKAFANGKG
jgi:peptidyl-prolyl cis-trans isomerase D